MRYHSDDPSNARRSPDPPHAGPATHPPHPPLVARVCLCSIRQITRVLIERLIVQKPHPWGLLVTLIELIKNPVYNIWQHSFVRSSKEIEQL